MVGLTWQRNYQAGREREREREIEEKREGTRSPRATPFPSLFRSSVAAIVKISMSRVERGRDRIG